MKKKTNIVIQFIFGDDKVLEFEDFDDALHYLVGYIFSVRGGLAGGGGAVTGLFTVLQADGTSITCPLTVLQADGTSISVPKTVLQADGTSISVN